MKMFPTYGKRSTKLWKNYKPSFKGAPSSMPQFLATERPSKIIKNVFYLTLKTLSAFKICKFLSCFLVMQKNNLVRKKKLISKFMTLSLGKKPIPLHILTNISRIKGNQTMKYGQLIEYNMRNIFLEKSYTKSVGETISRPFSKKLKLSISLNQ